MRVYMAGSSPGAARRLTEAFGDEGVDPGVLAVCAGGRENMVLRLAALARCDAIWLPADWRQDARARLEKAFADFQRIPEVSYCLPRRTGGM